MGFKLNPLFGSGLEQTSSGGGGGSGTVISVGLSLPSIFNVTGSPVTGSGTLSATLVNQNANLVLAGPVSGAAGTPTFRALVPLDIPTLTSAHISDFQTEVSLNLDLLGKITGPASATDNAIVRFDGTTGKLAQNSLVLIDDLGNISGTNLSGTNTGDVVLGISNGLSLFGQQLSLGLASATTTGALSAVDWVTFNSAVGTGVKLETHTLTGTDITNGYVVLTNTPVTAALTRMSVVTGGPQAYGPDFTIVSTNRLSWSGLALDGILSLGDILNIIIS